MKPSCGYESSLETQNSCPGETRLSGPRWVGFGANSDLENVYLTAFSTSIQQCIGDKLNALANPVSKPNTIYTI